MKASQFINDNKYKIFKTFLTYGTYFCIAGVITLIGSSLIDLETRFNADFALVSFAIPVRSAGHIVGSALAGILGQRFSELFVLCCTNLISGVFIGIAPFFTHFPYFAAFLFVVGINHGISDIACSSLLVAIWKEKCANWLQVLHMFWGLGSLVTPVLCRPFLLPDTVDVDDLEVDLTTHNSSIPLEYQSHHVKVQYAYLIVSILAMIISIPFGITYLYEKITSSTIDVKKKMDIDNFQQFYSPLKVYSAVAMFAVISHLIYAIETIAGTLGPSFSVKSDLKMDKKTGVLLATVFWSCFSFYRLIYIPLTFLISETKLLLISLTISLCGFLITVPWANRYESCIWAGFTLMGIGISPIFSAAYGMLAKHIIITSRISSMIFIPGVLGESMHPAIAATLMNHPIRVLYYIGVCGFLLILFYLSLLVYCAKVFNAQPNLQHREAAARSSIRSISRY